MHYFLDACPADADICLSLVRREAFEKRFPGADNAYVPLQDGQWTLGGSFLVNPSAFARNRTHLEQVFAARKSQFAMARLLGVVFLLRFLMRSLNVTHVEQRCQAILGCSSRAVRECPAELAFDIDRAIDYEYAVRGY